MRALATARGAATVGAIAGSTAASAWATTAPVDAAAALASRGAAFGRSPCPCRPLMTQPSANSSSITSAPSDNHTHSPGRLARMPLDAVAAASPCGQGSAEQGRALSGLGRVRETRGIELGPQSVP